MNEDETDMPDEADVPAEGPADTPLHRKLGLKAGLAGAVVAPPADDSDPLRPLPDGYVVVAAVSDLAGLTGPFDYLHLFVRNRADLVKDFSHVRDKLAPGGSLWVSWIKQSAARKGGGLPGDLNENTIRRLALAGGLVDVKVASLDNDWSALKLVWRRH
jgi:hypothetical protein